MGKINGKDVNQLDLLLLSMLAIEKMSGYDINKIIVNDHYAASANHTVYQRLNKLHELDYLTVSEIQNSFPKSKKIYSVTALGKEKLRRENILVQPKTTEIHNSFSIIALLSANQTYFEHKSVLLENRIAELQKLDSTANSIAKINIKNELRHVSADLQFATECIEHLQKEAVGDYSRSNRVKRISVGNN